jgi:alginate O-acetyltransferase complex protein AlgI
MLFCSKTFLYFFVAVITAYWALPWHRARIWLLLIASFYFYASWNKWLGCLIALSTMIDYLLARGMDRFHAANVRRTLVTLSVGGNLCLLAYFKYANFFLRSAEEALRALGAEASLPVLQVILPVGISFYTFEAISYMIDVYRRKIPAERSLVNLLLFITFFPHLVAGPIVRASDFLCQVDRRKRWSWLRANTGVLLILQGIIKKLALADRMGAYVDPVFADPAAFATATLWLAAVAYAVQIYCDFSGYSDMALGLAHLFGYHLATNFDMPFLAPNLSAFWRRWHMSLSSWIRDYIFIPLGGSRGTRPRTVATLLIAFTLCGMWHGAGWNFVVFGFVTGILVAVHVLFKEWCAHRPRLAGLLQTHLGTALRVALTFLCFCLTLVIFRNQHIAGGAAMLTRMFLPSAGAGLPLRPVGLFLTFAVMVVGHALGRGNLGRDLWARLPAPARGLSFGAALSAALLLAPGASKAFIYFQF